MQVLSLLLLSVSLAADAFSVSLCKGMKTSRENRIKHALIIALFFGVFQAVMPLIGWALSYSLVKYIEKFDHFIAFGVLAFIGVKMIVDAFRGKEEDVSASLDIKELTLLAVATSIDALAVGVTLAFDSQINIFVSVSVIGAVTFALCFAGVLIGFVFGNVFSKAASVCGGAILILIALKTLFEGIGLI